MSDRDCRKGDHPASTTGAQGLGLLRTDIIRKSVQQRLTIGMKCNETSIGNEAYKSFLYSLRARSSFGLNSQGRSPPRLQRTGPYCWSRAEASVRKASELRIKSGSWLLKRFSSLLSSSSSSLRAGSSKSEACQHRRLRRGFTVAITYGPSPSSSS